MSRGFSGLGGTWLLAYFMLLSLTLVLLMSAFSPAWLIGLFFFPYIFYHLGEGEMYLEG